MFPVLKHCSKVSFFNTLQTRPPNCKQKISCSLTFVSPISAFFFFLFYKKIVVISTFLQSSSSSSSPSFSLLHQNSAETDFCLLSFNVLSSLVLPSAHLRLGWKTEKETWEEILHNIWFHLQDLRI